MSTNIRNAQTGSNIQAMEAGTYPAVCCAVIDLGLQEAEWNGEKKEQQKILITWEFPTELIEYNGEMSPRQLSQTYTFSVNENAKLRQMLKTWRGRDFTDDELNDFDIKNIIGVPCMITVTQTVGKNGSTYANVAGVSKVMKGIEIAPPVAKIHFDIDDIDTWIIFKNMPQWIRDRINNSLTFKRNGIQLDEYGHRVVNSGSEQGGGSGMKEINTDSDLPF